MGLVDYIRSLRPRYKTALLSNAWSDFRGVLSERWKITDAFDEMVISAEVGIVKPDARIYRLALERLQVAPHELVFVDDFIENIDGGKAVGLHTIHFRTPQQAIEDLSKLLNSSN